MSKLLSKRTKSRLERLLANTGDMALKRRARRIIEELNPQDGDKILDAGCGDGFYLHLLSNLGLKLKLIGTDFDKAALKSARKNLKGKQISVVRADLMTGLPFKDDSFDKAIMSEVAEHLPDDVKGLKEVKRVLKPGGILVLSVPNKNFPFLWDPINWILQNVFGTHIKSGFWAGIWNQHLRLYKPDEIKKVLEEAKFKVEKIESLTIWSLPFNHHIVNIGARILAAGGGRAKSSVFKGSSKFEATEKRSLLLALYYFILGLVDSLNDNFQPNNQGVSLFVKAIK